MLLSAALLASVPSASASVTGVRATAQSTNVLRYDIRIATTEFARVAVQVWQAGTPVTSGWTTDTTTTASRNQTVTVWGMKPGTSYNYRILVTPSSGTAYTYSNRLTFTTAALPSNFPTLTATTHAGSPDFRYLMFDGRTVDTGQGLILITDTSGNVRWYQAAPTVDDHYGALYYDETEEAIYAILNSDRVVRYTMGGATTLDWALGAELSDYVHHEVQPFDGALYTLTARSFTQGGQSYVEDGIQARDSTGALVYEWWARTDGGLDITANAPYYWFLPGVGSWHDEFPTSRDWLHANSLQVREEADGVKGYISFRHNYQVIKVDLASGDVEWLLGANSTGSTDGLGDFTLSASGVSTSWWALQHHAHFEDDGQLYVFDNSTGGSAPSRALAMELDEGTMVATITREQDLTDLVDSSFTGSCDAQSGMYLTPHDQIVIACGPTQLVATYSTAGTLIWTLDMTGNYEYYRAKPLDAIGNG